MVWDPELGSSLIATNYVRQFEADAPLVIGVGSDKVFDGWTPCEQVEDRPPECCCFANPWPDCDGIMHYEKL
jgi:hypothetical protein